MPMHDWTRVDAGVYHHFHGRWLYAVADALNRGVLPAGFYALADHVIQPFEPDVIALRDGPPAQPGGGTRAAADPPAMGVVVAAPRRARKKAHCRVAVRHASGNRVVAVVELVSPGNTSCRRDFARFVNKAVDLIDEWINVVVADPFPPTARDPAGLHAALWKVLTGERFAPPPGRPLTAASYVGGPDAVRGFAEPFAAGEPVPPLPLFLTPADYVFVPMEAAYRVAWDEVPDRCRAAVEAA